MCGPLAAIDDLEFAKWELQPLGERFDAIFQLARFERREFVEERDNQNWVDCDGAELDNECESPEVEEELIAGLLDDLEERGAERYTEGERQRLAFDEVGEEEGKGLLVEPIFLLEHEVVVVAEREA